MRFKYVVSTCVASGVMITSALAHHSYSMFDHGKELTTAGTVTEWEYMNPHSWLHIKVTDANGKIIDFGFETRSPALLQRLGISRESMKPGDKVTVRYYPLKDGSNGGEIRALVLASGKEILYGPSLSDNPNYAY